MQHTTETLVTSSFTSRGRRGATKLTWEGQGRRAPDVRPAPLCARQVWRLHEVQMGVLRAAAEGLVPLAVALKSAPPPALLRRAR